MVSTRAPAGNRGSTSEASGRLVNPGFVHQHCGDAVADRIDATAGRALQPLPVSRQFYPHRADENLEQFLADRHCLAPGATLTEVSWCPQPSLTASSREDPAWPASFRRAAVRPTTPAESAIPDRCARSLLPNPRRSRLGRATFARPRRPAR